MKFGVSVSENRFFQFYAVNAANCILAPRKARYLRNYSTGHKCNQKTLLSGKNHVLNNEKHKSHNDQLFFDLSGLFH